MFYIQYDKLAEGKYVVHVQVEPGTWTPSSRREFISRIKKHARDLNYPLFYCYIPIEDRKLVKFVELFNFKLMGHEWRKSGFIATYRMNSKCYK
jgi:hypothetical protein